MKRSRSILILPLIGVAAAVMALVACGSSPTPVAYNCGYAAEAPTPGDTSQVDTGAGTFTEVRLYGTGQPKPPKPASTGGGNTTKPNKTTAPAPAKTTAPARDLPPISPLPKNTASSKPLPKPTVSLPPVPLADKKQSPKSEKAYNPPRGDVKPDMRAFDGVNQTLPQGRTSDQLKLSKSASQGYESPVTRHVYVYHTESYYRGLNWHDPYNPYDPWNWETHGGWYSPFDPQYHTTYVGYPASWSYKRVIVFTDRC